ncbi:class I adenylate-forming enzyme family protein [Azospirillum rugosum]|uniref:Acyl-coenzyme A synthetase/AMP-(Fatty) acid ligase/DNA-binding CsgD family transcriptional regulator n=1 Tax=Azospirillum rugosum TaxID=416170 RepID=A0ABS4SS52_9PROT|nr:class I adenylate-forming enzyme family protein [Azospirillum rugosum]MBP2295391.1 acyl-coenzyme A synthetase/AMP-(fatty) acid ligase/DNA-binding CsgD family transcriptional regulator [Azospirillum rugosum]MDQ0528766.1 acyl-coenzyme A synthetase/AMP-(fatty) acid ligase/DNA-binding CsgD family transcriptional regulator [Azospirillum rugosum]
MPPFSPDPAPSAPRRPKAAAFDTAAFDPEGPDRHAVVFDPEHRFDLHLAVAEGPGGALSLSARQCAALYWAGRGLTLEGIADRLGAAPGDVLEHIAPLAAMGAVALRPTESGASLAGDTLPALWDSAVAAHGDRPFLVPPGGGAPVTYREAGRRVEAMARRLAAARLPKGARVLIHAEPGPDAALLVWACARLGLVAVPVDSAWGETAVLAAIGLVRPALVFADARRAGVARASGRPAVILDGPGDAPALGFADWLASGGAAGPRIALPDDRDTAAILFTSGTTGAPKAVELSHGSLVRTARLLAGVCALTAEDRLLTLAEFHTVSGLRNPLLLAAAAGATTVLPTAAERAHPRRLADLCARERVTVLGAVPAALKGLAAASGIESGALGSLRLVTSTGAELPAATVERLRALTKAPVMTYYGLTETGGVCALGAAGRADGAIGRPADAVLQIVDPDGTPLPPGAVGELRVYGANLRTGHHRTPEVDVRFRRDGWVYTGDLAVRGEDGTIRLTGRARDLLKTARGDRLHLTEIERLLERDPAVAEAAACVLRDGSDGGDRAMAFVRLRDGMDPKPVVERLRQRALEALGHRGAPLDIRVRDDFPRAANGKVRRAALLDEPGGQEQD